MKKTMIKYYQKKMKQPMRQWTQNEEMDLVSVSDADKQNGSPKQGDMIAFNPNNLDDRWLVAKRFFDENYEEI